MNSLARRDALSLGAAAIGAAALSGTAGAALQAPQYLDDMGGLMVPLQRYIWGLDTLDAAEMRSAFTNGATLTDVEGKVWDRRAGGIAAYTAREAQGEPGGQHHLQVNRIRWDGRGYRVESYWSRVAWRGEGGPILTALGTYADSLVRKRGEWLIARREIAPWNNVTVKVPVVQVPAF